MAIRNLTLIHVSCWEVQGRRYASELAVFSLKLWGLGYDAV